MPPRFTSTRGSAAGTSRLFADGCLETCMLFCHLAMNELGLARHYVSTRCLAFAGSYAAIATNKKGRRFSFCPLIINALISSMLLLIASLAWADNSERSVSRAPSESHCFARAGDPDIDSPSLNHSAGIGHQVFAASSQGVPASHATQTARTRGSAAIRPRLTIRPLAVLPLRL